VPGATVTVSSADQGVTRTTRMNGEFSDARGMRIVQVAAKVYF